MFDEPARGNDAWVKNPRSVPLRVWSLRERFTPGERIADAGPGDCFIARDGQTGDGAVLRLLRLRQRPDAPSGVQLRQDLRRVALSPHPHIVRVLDFEVREASLALAHPLETGQNLSNVLTVRRLTLPECLTIGQHVAAALRFAHAHGVAHGALTPACVFLAPDGTARVRDFGVIHLTSYLAQPFPADAARRLTYAAFEERHALAATPAMDSFHLGALLCELLTGMPPPQGMIGLEMRRDVPADLRRLIARCLAALPESRPSMAEVATNLHAIEAMLRGKVGSGIVARLMAQRHPTAQLEDTVPYPIALPPPSQVGEKTLKIAPRNDRDLAALIAMPNDEIPVAQPRRVRYHLSPMRRLVLASALIAGVVSLAGVSGGIYAITHAAPLVRNDPLALTHPVTVLPARATPYLVSHTITIGAGKTLTLAAGVTLIFAPGAGIAIQGGMLQANGTSNLPVTLTAANDPAFNGGSGTAQPWSGVTIAASRDGTPGRANLQDTQIRFAGDATDHPAIACHTGALQLINSGERGSAGPGLVADSGCWGQVTGTSFAGNAGDAADVASTALLFTNNTVADSGVNLP